MGSEFIIEINHVWMTIVFSQKNKFFFILSDIDLILEKEKENVWEEEIQWGKLGQGGQGITNETGNLFF